MKQSQIEESQTKKKITRKVIAFEEFDSCIGKIWWEVTLICGHTKTVGGNYNQWTPPARTRCEDCERLR